MIIRITRSIRRPAGFLKVLGSAVLALSILGSARLAAAQTPQITLHVDGAHSEVHWTLKGTTHTARGTFQLKGGLVTFNPQTGVADGELLVDIASAGGGNKTRDNKMKTQVLESQKYPTAFFHPTLVHGTLKAASSQQLIVDGTLNIHGADHPLSLKVDVKVDGSAAAATTSFTIPYVAWGMRDPSVFLVRVAKQVDVQVVARASIEGLQAAMQAGSLDGAQETKPPANPD